MLKLSDFMYKEFIALEPGEALYVRSDTPEVEAYDNDFNPVELEKKLAEITKDKGGWWLSDTIGSDQSLDDLWLFINRTDKTVYVVKPTCPVWKYKPQEIYKLEIPMVEEYPDGRGREYYIVISIVSDEINNTDTINVSHEEEWNSYTIFETELKSSYVSYKVADKIRDYIKENGDKEYNLREKLRNICRKMVHNEGRSDCD